MKDNVIYLDKKRKEKVNKIVDNNSLNHKEEVELFNTFERHLEKQKRQRVIDFVAFIILLFIIFNVIFIIL